MIWFVKKLLPLAPLLVVIACLTGIGAYQHSTRCGCNGYPACACPGADCECDADDRCCPACDCKQVREKGCCQ